MGDFLVAFARVNKLSRKLMQIINLEHSTMEKYEEQWGTNYWCVTFNHNQIYNFLNSFDFLNALDFLKKQH